MNTGKDKSRNAAADSDYRAFLIRCWREGDNWHFTLETIGQARQQNIGFAEYNQLAKHLQKQFFKEDSVPGSDHQEGGPKK